MSCNIGTGSGSKAVKDIKVGISTSASKNISKVLRWDNVILWQRSKALTEANTSFNLDYNCSNTSSLGYYTATPAPYKDTKGDGHITYTEGSKSITLTQNVDYTIRWTNNRVPSTGTTTGSATGVGKVYIEGMGDYSGSFYVEFNISYTYKASTTSLTNNCDIDLESTSKTLTDTSSSYTATEDDLTIGISAIWCNSPLALLTKGTDYTVSYTYPTDKTYAHGSTEGQLSKSVTVTITGIGNYSGSASKTYYVYHSYVIAKVHLNAVFYRYGGTTSAYAHSYGDLFALGGSTVKSRSPTTATTGVYTAGFAYGNDTNLLVSTDGYSQTYPNLDTYSSRVSTGLSTAGSVCFGNGKFVVISKNGTTGVSSTDGKTWSSSFSVITLNTGGTSYCSCYGGGYFVTSAYGSSTSNNNTAKSSDGVTWTCASQGGVYPSSEESVPVGARRIDKICYCNGYFYSVSKSTNYVGKMNPSTEDSFSFCKELLGLIGVKTGLDGIASDGTRIVVVRNGYTDFAMSNPASVAIESTDDGSTWEAHRLPCDSVDALCYSNGKFLALSKGSKTWEVYSSSDSTSWELAISYDHGETWPVDSIA